MMCKLPKKSFSVDVLRTRFVESVLFCFDVAQDEIVNTVIINQALEYVRQ
jgi:hypothetical protein